MLNDAAVMVMLPGGVLLGVRRLRSVSMNSKSLGGAAQVNGVLAPGVLLTRTMFKLNRTPDPESGVIPSFENAEIRRVLIGPPPGKTFPVTFQLLAVNPAAEMGGDWKVMTVSSKVKSPWNPTRLSAALMFVVVTG